VATIAKGYDSFTTLDVVGDEIVSNFGIEVSD
jgi:hypothetical protein